MANPLADLVLQLCKRNQYCSSKFQELQHKEEWTTSNKQEVLALLAELFLHPTCTEDVTYCSSTILLDLVERVKSMVVSSESSQTTSLHQTFCIALSKAVSTCPSLKKFFILYLKNSSPFLYSEQDVTEPASKKMRLEYSQLSLSDSHPLELVQTAYRCVVIFGRESESVISPEHLLPFLSNANKDVQWFTVQTLATLLQMSARQRDTLMKRYFQREEMVQLMLRYRKLLLWPETNVNDNRVNDKQLKTATYLAENKLLDSHVVSVSGILLPKILRKPRGMESELVSVPTTDKNLQHLGHEVNLGCPVLLQGPVGCGKTCLVECLAQMTGRRKSSHLLKLQLGDQTDSRALLGIYQCTDVPGEFVWQPGILTRAVSEGYWVLLEDIDHAPMDVISLLLPLLENKALMIPSRGQKITASPGFQLFATYRTLPGTGSYISSYSSAMSALLEKNWTKLNLDPLSKDELYEIISQKYPALHSIIDRLLEIYFLLSRGEHVGMMEVDDDNKFNSKFFSHDKRLISTRDLLNWCKRIACYDLTSSAISQLVFQETLDCFCFSISCPKRRLQLAEAIGAKLNITKSKAEYYCMKYKPNVQISTYEFLVGRVILPKIKHSTKPIESSHHRLFSFTRQSSALLEKVAACVQNNDPVLLVGETGTGKTSTIQYLANQLGHNLQVINMNQQSDSTDLLGGFKPVDLKLVVKPFKDSFEELFCKTFSRKQNVVFLTHIENCYCKKSWRDMFTLMEHTIKSAIKNQTENSEMWMLWKTQDKKLKQLRLQVQKTESTLAFTFIEGTLVKALKKGDWVLLDEINLATTETLECLSSLLESKSGSVVLSERGDLEPVIRHSNFRLFACMNPATDVGKKALTPSVRNRFMEFYVDELNDVQDLKVLVNDYLSGLSLSPSQIDGLVNFYMQVRVLATKQLTDGTGHKPHYSLRTFCRALMCASFNPGGVINRTLYESLCMSFLTQLDRSSYPLVEQLVCRLLLQKADINSLLKRPIPEPTISKHLQFEGYWIPVGSCEPQVPEKYILTPSVRANLKDLARVVSIGRHPVLLQGETSVGKTSLVQWLATSTGHRCVRINNHEHTDLQEYIGSYAADETGKLAFKEGVLVEAMRQGYWIILDELNLAPTDVLEALNRLLDDNRELFIPETQEMVKAHPKFMLFATQNPPGHYGGRKALSRAFRNRFVELHFDEIPSDELETILSQRCDIPLSYAKKLVKVMLELQTRRSSSAVFAGKQGLMTLRDLFRWANRYHCSVADESNYDWNQHMADHGYMLIGGKMRKPEEEDIVRDILQKFFRRKVCPDSLFNLSSETSITTMAMLKRLTSDTLDNFMHIFWTCNMQRLAVLVNQALQYKEPVLLVGDTGCGKTTVCQMYAAMEGKELYSINCHSNTEGSDFLGGLRPVRNSNNMETEENDDNQHVNKLFEWVDGPLVQAMQTSSPFLVDEISLAEDSVLERLNSVLEPERTLLLSEKGSGDAVENKVPLITAKEDFRVLATMNPGGDFGKKELSPALRNRFTEIWCPQVASPGDMVSIIQHNLQPSIRFSDRSSEGDTEDDEMDIANAIMTFVEWFTCTDFGKKCVVSIRDLLCWVDFLNTCSLSYEDDDDELMEISKVDTSVAYVHGACLVFLDSLGTGTTARVNREVEIQNFKEECLQFLLWQVNNSSTQKLTMETLELFDKRPTGYSSEIAICSDTHFTIPPFSIPRADSQRFQSEKYAFNAPTTCMNAQRILRALQLPRPILLEGSPGVGKTSLVAAIAEAAGQELVRINLSEQTDVSDLFGADLPVEGEGSGLFSWRDGPLLQALKSGQWIILDELNLASQSVLEGLNACLDHRGEVFIPELGKTFYIQQASTRIFACQNPYHQGGGRKGLPRSFLNRFTKVFIDALNRGDLQLIATTMYPSIPEKLLSNMVHFNMKMQTEVVSLHSWGQKGGPWEFNLRDLFRWCELLIDNQSPDSFDPGEYLNLIYADRMQTKLDRDKVIELYQQTFSCLAPIYRPSGHFSLSLDWVQCGHSFLQRHQEYSINIESSKSLKLLPQMLPVLESLMKCVQMNWMTILIGSQNSGKTSTVQMLAELTGNRLQVLPMNSAMDTTELLGGFEQVDIGCHIEEIATRVKQAIDHSSRKQLALGHFTDVENNIAYLYHSWHKYCCFVPNKGSSMSSANELSLMKKQIKELDIIIGQLLNLNREDSNELLEMDSQLTTLSQSLERIENTSNSNTFEWINSTLVRALQSGDWLLVENVNFCNPSVLDRLNALLEPSGVLTVSERGVIDGEVPEIAPHSNFRLFFTMDPKYGNISRAMRNRGVEIYILEDPAGVENLNSEFSLCNSDGSIRTSRAQFPTASLPLIQQYCSYPLLTHAQHLVSVYIEVLRQVLSSAYCCPNVSSSRWPLANFIQLVTNHVHGQNWKLCSELISPLLTEVQLEVNCSDLSTYGGWKFVCGQHDLPELTQVTLIALFGHPLKDILLNCLSSMKTCNNGAEILMRGPYDFQWNKQALYKMMSVCNAESTSTISLLEQLTGVINRIKLSQVLTVEWQLSQEKYKKWEALCEGTQNIASENSAHLKVFVYIDNILVGLRQELRAAFSEQGDCSDKQFYQIYCGLPWLNRLLDVALLHWERELSPPSAANLSLVWNWTFSKLLMPLISHNSPVKLSDKIDKVINHLHDLLSDRKSSSKLLKKILASWGNPTPFFSKWEYLQWQKLQCLAEKIDIFAEDKIKQITLLQTDLLKLNRANITEQFVELITQLNSRMKSTENQQMFESLLDNLELKINSVHSPDSSEQDSECQGSTSVQTLDNDQRLWPLYEHTVLAVERRILNFLLEQHEPELVTWLPPFIEFMKQHLVVSPLNLAEYRKLLSSLGQGNSKSFYSTILSSYFQHWWKNSINGLSLDDFKLSERILGPGIAISSCLVEVIHSLISSHQLKSYGSSNYRFSTDNCVLLPQVAIGHHKNEAQLFAKIRSHLWVHTASLSSLQFNGRNIERKNILESLQHTLMAIGFTLPQFCESDVPDLHLMNNKSTHINTFLSHMKDCCYFDEIVVKLTERAINCVQDMFLDANESNTSAMSIGTALVLVGLLQSYLLGPCGHLDPVERDKLKLSHLQEDLEMINLELKMENLFNELMNGQSFLDLCHNQLHPQIIWLMEYREKLTNKVHGLLSRTAYRPDISSFPMIKQEYANYHMAAGSHELILTFLHKAKTMSEEHFESNEVSRLLQELESWQKTVHNFVQKMQINYPVYRDILTPFYSSLYQMSHGFALIMQSLQTTCCRQKLAKLCNLSNETEFSWLENLCVCMAKFPSCSRNYPNFLELATALTSDLTLQLSHAVVSSQTKTDDSKSISRTNQEIHSQLLLSGLCHLKNHVLTAQELSSPVLDRFASILRLFVSSWHKQQEEQKRLEQERDSLYRFKTIHHDSSPNDERLNEIDFKKRFPNYQNDFIDFIPSNLLDESSNNVGNKSGGDNSAADTDEDEPLSLLITKEEMKEICTIHHQIFTNYTKNSHWIAPGSPEQYDPGVGVDLLKPFLLNYKTAMSLSSYLKACLHEGYDMQVVGGHLLVVAALEEVINHNETTKLGVVKEPAPERYYDVYQDANISEIVQAEPVLRRLLQRLSQLLEEWPDHPTLRQLETISKRILTFPLTSPIMKILSGLELLLYKAQDWESVAAKHVSLETELHDISNLIVDWRKFELSYWKNSLDITSHEVEIEACQWWFHLYQLVISFVTPETDDVDKSKPVSDIEKEIIASLKLFLENSSLGEFKARLQIVYAFHCQLINMDTSPQQQLMCRLLWNIHEFYKQFLPFVEADIEQKRVPIEKELKGFVKIARWNDINYWALKQDTDKTHRTVHKHIRSFKKILHESVKTVLASNKSLINTDTNNEDLSAEVWMRPIALTEDKCANKEFEICLPLAPENSLMSRLTHLMPRACKHYHDLEKKTPYLKLLLAFDEFTCEVIEGIEERSRLHVSPSLEIEKQKKQAKHINLKQRQGLSELYRNLTKIGLSYKKGLIRSEQRHSDDFLYVDPVDVKTSIDMIGTSSPHYAPVFKSMWQSGEQYYWNCLARQAQLKVILENPEAKDFGLSNVDRCRGYSEHLKQILLNQHAKLSAFTKSYCQYHKMILEIKNPALLKSSSFPSQAEFSKWLDTLENVSVKCWQGLSQFQMLLKCCPQANPSGNTSCVTPLPVHMLPQTAFMSINNQTWNVCIEKINDILSKLKTILKKPVTKLKTKSIFSWNDLCFLDAGYLRLKESLVPLQQIKRMFLEPEYNSDSSFSESLSFLQLEIETNTNAFFIWKQRQSDMKTEVLTTMTQQLSGQTSDCEGLSDVNQKDRTLPFDMSLNDLTDSFDNLIKQVLLAIQKLLEAHKKTAKSDDPPKGSGDKEGSSPETCDNDIEILNGHLTQCLQQSLFTDIKNLDCDKVFKIIKELLQVIQSPSEHLAKFSQQQMASELSMKSIWLKCFVGCLPLLELFECLLENYLLYLLVAYRTTAKLYSELLTHFIELATKGFFILPELSDETQEGATQFEDKEDAGMGEGEGVKDVSDQIEDENQLEDVHHKDKQKPDEPENQPDIASEDNAIEMSEDFDGKIHDPDEEVDENDSENENEDEEDIDKQMGDVESKGSDKLDEQLWGSDEEDEETPMEEEKESGTGAGQEEEKQIVAKNENEVKAEEKKNKDEGKEEEEEEGKENPEDKKEDKVNEPEAMDESECNDKVDPYHGKPQQEETAENLELPEDLKLDEAENDKEKEEKMDTSLQEDEEKDKDPTEDKETASMDEEPETQEREAEKDKKADEMEEEDGSGNEGKSKEDPTAPPESVEEDEGVEEEEEGVKDNKADMSDAEDEESEKTKNIDDIPAVVELKEENKDESGEDDDSEAVKDASKFYGMTDDQNQKAECEFALDTGGDNEKEKDRKQQTDGANTAPSDAEAYHSKTSTEISHGTNEDDSQKPQTRKPGMTDDNRSLGMQDKPHQRHARTIEEIHHDTGMEEEVEKPKDEKADLYQHVTESTSHYDQQIMDVATEDQQKACAADYDEDDDEDDDDIESIKDSDASYYEEEDFDEDEDDEDDDDVEMIESNIVKNSVQPNVIEEYVLDDDDDEDALVEGDESQVQDNSIEIPGSKIVTEGASRPPESSIHTVIKYLDKEDIVDMEELRAEIEEQLSIWSANQHYGNVVDFERQASDLWQMYEQMTNALAQELCEQLRLVLEPSQATKLKGDYRTGKRINMKKVIPYIASQFRKDKIWLRRTKPSKRQYQIMLAIDDSSSMIDNHSKQLAFESLAVIANGLSLLETGELAICSFGESMQVIHSFGEQFSCHSGARLLQHFTFTQKKTNIALLLQQASALMMESRQHYRSAQSGPDFSQLLLIVSDGRGLFSEGMDYVKSAVRQAQTANLFVVFVILDNPINRDSILDIRIPVFKASGQLPEIKSYMDHFPFPFYIILRDIDSLPQTLSEALRQWFELVTAETQ
ncbi:midasin-like [Octopus sinensis]|uniref:Midasin n=1 Tax=Octopus sinensis TaxID=2607531 RepID=A0A6P7TCC2_9MOLL|nr:midasin-like [Octopus sinensis]XP_036366755.1 midasin-like [Octopus sinensis]